MTGCIIRTAHACAHWCIMWVMVMRCAIRAVWVMMVIPIHMLPIHVVSNAVIWTPPYWPIIPVEWRMPAYPRWSPKPIIDHRAVDIYRLNDIVCAIYILITNHLYSYRLCRFIFLYEDRCYILIDIFSQYGLYHYQVAVLVRSLNHAQIIHITITIQIQVGECRIWVVEHLLKLF